MPMYTTIGGVQRELTAIPVVVDGVQRELSSLSATIDGVLRDIFLTANSYTWEKYSVRTYFVTSATSERVYATQSDSFVTYNADYVEAGTTTTTGAYLSAGVYFQLNDVVYKFGGRETNYFVSAYPVTSYEARAGSYVGTVESADSNAYPANGQHTDGYWYVKTSGGSGDSGGSLISFTVTHEDGTIDTYYAEEGMTFGEWVGSKYNTDGYVWNYNDDDPYGYIDTSDGSEGLIDFVAGSPPSGFTVIRADGEYWLMPTS